MNYNFKRQHAFSDRQRESIRVRNSYPDRIPVICERSDLASADCPYIDKKKYLVPGDVTVGQFISIIRLELYLLDAFAIFSKSNEYPLYVLRLS